MYAMTKHIKKAMAAFLCACLLLSYNPAAGMVPTAEAANEVVPLENPKPTQSEVNDLVSAENGGGVFNSLGGEADTNINVVTYDGSLQTTATPSFSANIQQLSENEAKLIVMALSPQAKNKNSYTFTWTVSRDGGDADDSLATGQMTSDSKILIPQSNGANDNCVSVIDLRNLFDDYNPDTTYFADGHTYTFTCVTECAGDEVTNTIELVTVDPSKYNNPEPDPKNDPEDKVPPNPFDPDYPNTNLPDPDDDDFDEKFYSATYPKRLNADNGVAGIIYTAQGGFSEDAKLQSAKMTPSDAAVYGEKFNKAARDTGVLPADPKDADYELGPILVNSITGDFKDKTTGAMLPAYIGELTMLIPVDNSANSPNGEPRYNYNDTDNNKIWVLYQDPTTSDVKAVEAIIVKDPGDDDKLKAAFVINDTTGPYMPGTYALAYAPSKVMTNPNPTDPDNPIPVQPLKSHYTINSVNNTPDLGSIQSTVTAPGEGVWSTGDASTGATYTFVPAASKVEEDCLYTYTLKSVKFGLEGEDEEQMEIVSDAKATAAFVNIDGQVIPYSFSDGILMLTNCKKNATYSLFAEFSEKKTKIEKLPKDPDNPDPDNPVYQTYDVNVSIVADEGVSTIGNATVSVSYTNNKLGEGAIVLNRETPSATVKAVLGSTVIFNVIGSQSSDGKTYYLKEIRSASGLVTPVSDTTQVTNELNGNPVQRQFVIGERTTTYEPTAKLEATFKAGDHGSIEGYTGPIEFQKDATGAMVTLKGDEGFYPASVCVTKTDDDLLINPKLSLGNADCKNAFNWPGYTAYPFNVTFTVNFEPIPVIPTYKVYLDDVPEHGVITPSGWSINNDTGYREGTKLVFAVKPDEGYKLENGQITVTFADADGFHPKNVDVVGGFATVVMEADVYGIDGNFVEIPSTEKPQTYVSKNFELGVYVATDSATLKDKNVLGYALGSSSDADMNILMPSDTDKKWDISLSGYGLNGEVNSDTQIKTKVTATRADGYPTFSLSMDAKTGYEVEKILVVKYHMSGADKVADKRTLYYNAWYAFDVTDINSDTDVVVYFKKLDENETPAYNPSEIDWVYVTTNYYPENGVASATYPTSGKKIKIVKGQGYTNRITPKDAFRWDMLRWNGGQGGEVESIKGSASAQTVNLTSVQGNTDIWAWFKDYKSSDGDDPDEPSKATYYSLSAPSNMTHGSVLATVGKTERDLSTGTWSDVLRGSKPVSLLMTPESGYYLSGLSFALDDDASYKLQVNEGDKLVRFVSDSIEEDADWKDLDTFKNYAVENDKTLIDGVEWKIAADSNGLQGNLYIAPTFALTSGGGSGTGDGDNNGDNGGVLEPNPEDIRVVNATVTAGRGSIFCSQAKNGFPIRVARTTPERTVTLRFIPGAADIPGTTESVPYTLTNVTVTKRPDNFVSAALEALATALPIVQSDSQDLSAEALKNGYLTLVVDASYDIQVEFGFSNDVLEDAKKDTMVLVNAQSDPYKGTVTPTSTPAAKKDGTPQFVVSPFKNSSGLYYSVESVDVTYTKIGNDNKPVSETKNVPAGTKSDYLTWDTSYANVFTLNVGALELDNTNTYAVTVTVNYSNDPNVAGNFGEGGSSETPALSLMKKMKVIVDGGVGGSVNPENGPFYVLRDKDDKDEWTTQRVSVSAEDGYHVSKMVVTIEGDERPDLAAKYLESVEKYNYFLVSTRDQGYEIITVFFEQNDFIARTFVLTPKVVEDAVESNVVPNQDVRLEAVNLSTTKSKTATFTAAPGAYGWAVSEITDTFTYDPSKHSNVVIPADWPKTTNDNDTVTVTIPGTVTGSVTWSRDDDVDIETGIKDLHNIFTAGQVDVTGLGAVSRDITVSFKNLTVNDDGTSKLPEGQDPDNDPNYDYSGPNNPNGTGKDPASTSLQKNIKVKVWGSGGRQLDIDPAVSMEGIYLTSGCQFPYSFYVPPAAADEDNHRLRIYCVEINGKIVHGNKTVLTGDDLLTEYSMVFDENNMTRKTNTLNVYVRYFQNWQVSTSEKFNLATGQIEVDTVGGGEAVKDEQNGTYSVVGRSAAATASVSDRLVNFNGEGNGSVGYEEDEEPPADTGDGNKTETPGTGEGGGASGETDTRPIDYVSTPPVDFEDGEENIPVDCYFVPEPGKVVSRVVLQNCEIVDYAWVTVKDVDENVPDMHYTEDSDYAPWLDWPIVLKYSLMRINTSESAYAIARFKDMPTDSAQRNLWKTDPERIYGEEAIMDNSDGTKPDNVNFNAALSNTIQVTVIGDKLDDLSNSEVLVVDPNDAKNADWYIRKDLDTNKITYKTIKFDYYDDSTGSFRIYVGPLIDTDEDGNPTVVYTIKKDWIEKHSETSTDPESMKLKVEHLTTAEKQALNARMALLADGEDDGNGASTDEGKEKCYQNYVITGNVKKFPNTAGKTEVSIEIPLEKKELKDVELPDFADKNKPGDGDNNSGNDGNNQGDGDNNQNQGTTNPVLYTVQMTSNGHGSLQPYAMSDGSYTTTIGGITVKSGTVVRLRAVADPGYQLVSLSRDGDSCVLNGEYKFNRQNGSSPYVEFIASGNTTLNATFVPEAEAYVDWQVQVVGGLGETRPSSGTKVSNLVGTNVSVQLIFDKTKIVPYAACLSLDGKDGKIIPLYSYDTTIDFRRLTDGELDGITPEIFNESMVIKVSFKEVGTNGNPNGLPNADEDLLPFTGQTGYSATGAPLAPTGDTLWLVVALVVVAAGATTVIVAIRRRKMAAATRAARAAKYSVTPRKRR